MRLGTEACMRQLAQCRAELVGFGRFFRNPKVMVEEIVSTAGERAGEASANRDVLLIQDTSEVNYQSKAGRKRGLGRVGNGTDIGLFVHPALVVDAADGSVLGLAGGKIWRRFSAKDPDYQSRPIETKESHRWIETPLMARDCLARARSVTVVADREADIYELFARVPDATTHLVIRATSDRCVCEGGRLFAMLAGQPEAGRVAFDLPARPGRKARPVTLAIRLRAITLKQPVRGRDRRDRPAVPVFAVEAREIDPPPGTEPILWRLLTTHQVSDLAQAVRVIEIYRRRWTIEQLFRTLKSHGFDIEDSLIEDGEALERLAACALVAATMVMQLVHARGEAGASLPATRVFTADEIAVLDALTPKLDGTTLKQRNSHPKTAWPGPPGTSPASADGPAMPPNDPPDPSPSATASSDSAQSPKASSSQKNRSKA
jgi:hypothetical protein